jgi:hypothetical protein
MTPSEVDEFSIQVVALALLDRLPAIPGGESHFRDAQTDSGGR